MLYRIQDTIKNIKRMYNIYTVDVVAGAIKVLGVIVKTSLYDLYGREVYIVPHNMNVSLECFRYKKLHLHYVPVSELYDLSPSDLV